jgi:predicted DNA-binding transcriptional regulator AlpA
MPEIRRRLLDMNEVLAMTGAARRSILRWIEAGRFPPPLRIGKAKMWWNREEIEDVLKNGYRQK